MKKNFFHEGVFKLFAKSSRYFHRITHIHSESLSKGFGKATIT
jgi:hypothetical protein